MDPVSRAINLETRFPDGRWKPGGPSPNPTGRPKRKPITDLCEEIINDPATREKIKQQLISTLTSRGMAGVLLLRELAERTEGKITQGVELSGTVNAMTNTELLQRMASLLEVKIDIPDKSGLLDDNQPARLPESTEVTTL